MKNVFGCFPTVFRKVFQTIVSFNFYTKLAQIEAHQILL